MSRKTKEGLEFNETYKPLIYTDVNMPEENINITTTITEVVLDAIKVVGVGVKAEITNNKYIFLPRHQVTRKLGV
jgi:hypothetical protein